MNIEMDGDKSICYAQTFPKPCPVITQYENEGFIGLYAIQCIVSLTLGCKVSLTCQVVWQEFCTEVLMMSVYCISLFCTFKSTVL